MSRQQGSVIILATGALHLHICELLNTYHCQVQHAAVIAPAAVYSAAMDQGLPLPHSPEG